MFLRLRTYELGIFYANQTSKCLRNQSRTKARVGRPQIGGSTPPPLLPSLLLAVLRRLFCFGSLVILDVACCYLWLFALYINVEIGKNSC